MSRSRGNMLGWKDCHPKIQNTMAASARIMANNKYFRIQSSGFEDNKPNTSTKCRGKAQRIFQLKAVAEWSVKNQRNRITKPSKPHTAKKSRSQPRYSFFCLYPK